MADTPDDAPKTHAVSVDGGHLINTHTRCPQCGGTDFEVRDYDPVWRDGKVWCRPCNVFVRSYDAG